MSDQENLRHSGSFPEVAVLLATHNPTPVVKEQIESIYSQELVKVKVYWGDDRSNEESKEYVRSLLKGKNFVEIKDTGIGAAKNFLHLLRFPTEPYIAFSDQDDIWLPRKLAQHVELLKNSSELSALSHSNSLLLIDGEIRFKESVCNEHTFHDLSWQNCVQGCTVVINSEAQKILNRSSQKYVIAHDWWAAQTISLFGKIYINENSDVLYRIHSGNSIGNPNSLGRIINSISRDTKTQSRQNLEVLENFMAQNIKDQRAVEAMYLLWSELNSGSALFRLKLAFSGNIARKYYLEDFWRRLMLVFRAP